MRVDRFFYRLPGSRAGPLIGRLSDSVVTIWTIGHSTRTLEELKTLLQEHQIDILADVRTFPTSARCPHFKREHLVWWLSEADIHYCWLGMELGGYRKKQHPHSPHLALISPGFRNYADHTASKEFRRGVEKLQRLAINRRVAIMCAEKLWWRCHRSLLSDYLAACCCIQIMHILEAGRTEPHRLHRAARLVEGRLVYDLGEQARLW
ncbi:MAG: hypothetical protein DMG05_11870 [Acidobacteria bacterium]|nr:MAG: hypothetical protein DMG05_11870 [Acidobacteriota bacterium]